MSIEKYIERFREKYQHSQLIYGYEELEDDFRTSLEEYERELLETPMGASNWLNHGIKYGYLDYFKFKTK